MDTRINKILDERKANGTYRSLAKKHHLVDFCSNDYLGFAQNEHLHQLVIGQLKSHSTLGATGSRLITGNHTIHEQLEAQLAAFFNAEAALLFSSGYGANTGLIPTLARKADLIAYDKLVHASLHDGIRLSKADAFSFAHNDLAQLENLLQKNVKGKKFIVVESIYSMDGDACPLAEMVKLSKRHDAHIILDEAHSTGLYENGKGFAHQLGVHNDIYARVHTFGKAIGYHGAVIVGNKLLKDYLINYCRPFIYTSAPPAHFVETLQVIFNALPNIQKQAWLQLLDNTKHFISLAEKHNIYTIKPNGFIQSIIIGNAEKAKQASAYLEEQGFYVKAIVSPTVPIGKERLRVCLHSFNTQQQITDLVHAINCTLTN